MLGRRKQQTPVTADDSLGMIELADRREFLPPGDRLRERLEPTPA